MTEIASFADKFGLWAALFTFLLFYVLRENSKREEKYQKVIENNQTVIEKLANIIDVKIEDIQKTVCEFIKDMKTGGKA